MHYLQALVETYNNNLDIVGNVVRDERGSTSILLPPFHSTRQGHIRIALNEAGEFLFANVDKQYILLPVTEDSESRSGKAIFPHPLHEQIKFVAKGFSQYATYMNTEAQEAARKGVELHQELMCKWLNISEHPKVRAIYTYIENGTMMNDLIKSGILPLSEEGSLLQKWSGKDKPPLYKAITEKIESAMVYFDVLSELEADENGEIISEIPVWEDKTVQQSYLTFTKTQLKQRGFCYLSGKEEFVTLKHPKALRHAGDGTKLISVNNDFMLNGDNLFTKEFVYEGDSNTGEIRLIAQPASISAEASHKSHNMLRWLIQRQGIRFGNKVILVWGTKQAQIKPQLNVVDEFVLEDLNFEDNDEDLLQAIVAERLKKAFKSYDVNFENIEETVNILVLDSMSSNGRLQVLGFQQLSESDYLGRIAKWQEQTRWAHPTKPNEMYLPSIYQMAHAVYGKRYSDENRAANIKRFYNDIFHCIMDGRNIPTHYIQTIVRRVINPMSFDGNSLEEKQREWKKALRIACSMLRRYYYNTEKGIKKLKLEETSNNREFLFGRLLAIAQVVEKRASQDKTARQTNAERLMNQFAQTPMKTWRAIYLKLQPYLNKMQYRDYYEKQINEILCLFEEGQFSNKPLNGLFLQGFALQLDELYKKKNKESADLEELDLMELNEEVVSV